MIFLEYYFIESKDQSIYGIVSNVYDPHYDKVIIVLNKFNRHYTTESLKDLSTILILRQQKFSPR